MGSGIHQDRLFSRTESIGMTSTFKLKPLYAFVLTFSKKAILTQHLDFEMREKTKKVTIPSNIYIYNFWYKSLTDFH